MLKIRLRLSLAFGVGQREVVELKERFDFTPVLFPVANPRVWSPFDTASKQTPYAASMDESAYREAAGKLYAELPSCDVVLIGKSRLGSIPTNDLSRLLGRVRDGAGLLWIAFGEEPERIPGVTADEIDVETIFPVSAVKSLRGTRVYEGTLGKGRVLQVVYRFPTDGGYGETQGQRKWQEPLTPFESDDPLGYDLCLAFVGKCVWRVMGEKRGLEGLEKVERTFNDLGLFGLPGRLELDGERRALVGDGQRTVGFGVAERRAFDEDVLRLVDLAPLLLERADLARRAGQRGRHDSADETILKENCYVFDFAFNRALKQIADYSANLTDKTSVPAENVRNFINFMPVICYDGSKMIEVEAGEILDLAYSGVSGPAMARRWNSANLINISPQIVEAILNNGTAMAAIKKIQGFANPRGEMQSFINRTERIGKLKAKARNGDKKAKRELTEEERLARKERAEIEKKLRKFVTRIPIFMYLSD